MEKNKEFEKADKKFDEIIEKDKVNAEKGVKEGFDKSKVRSQIKMRAKTFMKISDVDSEDAKWFKTWCDTHTDKKQFLGIKVIRSIMENLDPIVKNVIVQLNSITPRVDSIENYINQQIVQEVNVEEVKEKVVLPTTQAGEKKNE